MVDAAATSGDVVSGACAGDVAVGGDIDVDGDVGDDDSIDVGHGLWFIVSRSVSSNALYFRWDQY